MCHMIFYLIPRWKGQLIVEEGELQELIFNSKLKEFTIRALELMKTYIMAQEYESAYELADMLHALPEIVIDNNKKGLKQYWKNYVKPFQKNGSVIFLMSGNQLPKSFLTKSNLIQWDLPHRK